MPPAVTDVVFSEDYIYTTRLNSPQRAFLLKFPSALFFFSNVKQKASTLGISRSNVPLSYFRPSWWSHGWFFTFPVSWKVPALHLGLFGGAMLASDRMIFYDYCNFKRARQMCPVSGGDPLLYLILWHQKEQLWCWRMSSNALISQCLKVHRNEPQGKDINDFYIP